MENNTKGYIDFETVANSMIHGHEITKEGYLTNCSFGNFMINIRYQIEDEVMAMISIVYDMENEYNSASAQRQRLEDAGLNPYLMMNGGDAGSASSLRSPDAPTMQRAVMENPANEIIGKTNSMIQAGAQIAQLGKQFAETRQIQAQTENMSIQNAYLAEHLRGPPGFLAPDRRRGVSLLPGHGPVSGPLCERDGLHPCGADAHFRTSAGRLLGLSGHRLLRRHLPVRHPP